MCDDFSILLALGGTAVLALLIFTAVEIAARHPFPGTAGSVVYWLLGGWVWGPLKMGPVPMSRRLVERIVVSQITTVVRQNLPLATGLVLAAESERGWARTYLGRIAKLLGQGLPLSESMRIAFPFCSTVVVSLVEAGEKAGQLPAALEQAETYLVERARRREIFDATVWPYLVTVMGFMGFMVAGIMIAVVPKFKEIFKDFEAELPGVTRTLIEISEWFVSGLPPGWMFFVLPVPVIAYFLYQRRGFPEPTLKARITDWIRWRLPGLRRIEFGEGMAVMLNMLRYAVGSGMGLAPAARLAAGIDVNLAVRRRMTQFAALLADGVDAGQASDTAGLGEVTTTALRSGQRSGNMDTALRYAAEYHDAIMSRWWIVVKNVAWPLTTLVMATLVGFVVVALFLPMIALINSVTGG